MGVLLKNVFGWIFSKFGLFVVLVIGSLCVPIVLQLNTIAKDLDPEQAISAARNSVRDLTPKKGATSEQVNRQLMGLRALQAKKVLEKDAVRKESCFLPTCILVNRGKAYRIDMELDMLGQAIAYGEIAKNGPNLCKRAASSRRELQEAEAEDRTLDEERPFWAPESEEHQKLKKKIVDLRVQVREQSMACSKFRELSDVFEGKNSKLKEGVHAEYLKKIQELKDANTELWNAVLQVLPTALLALAGIILMPLVVSTISFFGMAPLATKRFGVQLLPESSGELQLELGSERQLQVRLQEGWELLADPALVHGVSASATVQTRYLLDCTMPLSSLACGLYLLTSIRSKQDEELTISARPTSVTTGTALAPESSQIAVLDLPEGAALALQPRCLIGIIQRLDAPVRISRHWRLGHLSSWLTMQLRYVVFHGPVKLIVRGNGGVRVGNSKAGVSINQAATLGFSANLRYGVSRCEPFYAYSSGKKELFEDSFSMGPGYYVQEVSPVLVEGGPLRRPWEVAINAFLKAFGLG